jgi:hypothetical protein
MGLSYCFNGRIRISACKRCSDRESLLLNDGFQRTKETLGYINNGYCSVHGFTDMAWEAAKAEGKAVLAKCARDKKMISYTDFMYQIRSISFETPYDSRLPQFLAEISMEEAKAGRGMMTALVVRKDDQRPGAGFFELAERLGYDVSDPEKFWIEEVNRVFASWQKNANQ